MLKSLIEPTGSRPLGLARIGVGAAATIRAFVAWPVLSKLADPDTLKAPYAAWLPNPTIELVIVLLVVWVVAAVLFTIGWRVFVTGPVLLAAIILSLALDQQAYSNHLYLMAWLVLLLTLADAGAGLSIERKQRPVVRWTVLLLMMQVSVVYGFAAITKLNPEFLSGQTLSAVLHGGLLTFPDFLRTESVFRLLAIGTVIVELGLAVFLWRPALRPAAFVAGLGLHISILLFMAGTPELIVFSLELLALYPLFLMQDGLRVVWDDQCDSCRDWIRRFRRFDLLDSLVPIGVSEPGHDLDPRDVQRSMHLIHGGETTWGFAAITRILEHLVPTLWVAPILRLPGVRSLGERWYRWQAARRSCPVGLESEIKAGPPSG